MHDIIVLVVGIFIGGCAAAGSAKAFGWFNKQEKSIVAAIDSQVKKQ